MQMFPETHIITTERLKLLALTPELYSTLFNICSDEVCMHFLGLQNPNELEEEKEKYRKGMSTYKVTFVYFQIWKDDERIGDCGFHTWYIKHDRAEIGYSIRNIENRSKGYMSEIFPELLRYGFETMGLHRIEAMVGCQNIVSQRLLLKHGFKQEGLLREHYLVGSVYEDSMAFSLLQSEWDKS